MNFCGSSTVGSAPPCQGGGRQFESGLPLHSICNNFHLNFNHKNYKYLITHRHYKAFSSFISKYFTIFQSWVYFWFRLGCIGSRVYFYGISK